MPILLSPGEKLEHGHYTVIQEIGVGGMGVVYHCRDELLLRDIAVKMLLPELMTDKNNFDVFRQEARLAAQLEHPNIVTIYDIGVEEKDNKPHHYLAMEYLPGGNLSGTLSDGALAVEHCLNWMKQLASGLSFAHKRGVVHQDIKADNIFITTEGDIKIGDFGLAKLLVGRVHYNASIRGMGTPAYMSPELCRGEPQDYRSDIYSLGVLFFEMATGQLPFQARGMIDMAMKHTSAPIPSVRRLNPHVPEVLERLIHKMMAKNPQDRYQATADVLSVLDELIFELRVARLGLRNKGLLRSGPIVLESETAREAPSPPEEKPAKKLTPDQIRSQPIPPAKPQERVAPPEAEGRGIDRIRKAGESPTRISGARLGALLKAQGLKALDLRWTFKSNGPIGWSASPVTDRDEQILYVASTDNCLYAIDTQTGSKLWAHRTEAPFLAGPILLGDKVLVTNASGNISLLGARDGVLQWSFKTGKRVVATPTASKDAIIIASLDGKIQAIDYNRGQIKWEFDCREPIAASAQSYADQLFFGTKDGTFHALNIDSGQPLWKFQSDGPIVAGSAVSVDSVYFGTQSGTYYALEAESGRLIWDYPTSRAITSRGAIVFTSVIFCSQDKWLYCCEKYGGGLVWKGAVRGTTIANLVSSRTSVLTVTREGWMQAFQATSGEMKWQRDLARCVETTPLITSSMLFVPTVEGDVLAYSLAGADSSAEKSA
jgi:serine/threonine protein kinase